MTAALTIAARRARVVALTQQGFTATEIAAVEGLTMRTVYRIRQELGASRERFAPLSDDELRTAAQLLDDGCSCSEVARTLGRNQTTISKHFPGRGWPVESGQGPSFGATNRWMKRKALQTAGVRL